MSKTSLYAERQRRGTASIYVFWGGGGHGITMPEVSCLNSGLCVDREQTYYAIQMNPLSVVQENATDAKLKLAIMKTLQNCQVMPEWLIIIGHFSKCLHLNYLGYIVLQFVIRYWYNNYIHLPVVS
jgi:hypothetical protein